MNKNKTPLIDFFDNKLQQKLNELDALREDINKNGRMNKVIFAILLVPCLGYSYYEIWVWAETIAQTNFLFLIILIIIALFLIFLKPYTLVGKEKLQKFNSMFKNDIMKSSVKFIDSKLSYQPIFKTNKQLLLKSRLFSKITEHKENGGVIGEIDNCKIWISKLHIMKELKNTFNGLFVHLRFDNEILINKYTSDINEGIIKSNSIYLNTVVKDTELLNVFNDFQNQFGADIKISIVKKSVFFSFKHQGELFESSPKKSNNDQIKDNIKFLNTMFLYLRKIIQTQNRE